jgi:cysteine-rich repeat protein
VESCLDGFCAEGPAPSCGDGNIDTACGEECDDGGNEANDGCSAVCITEVPECQTDQTCDDGNPCTDDVCDTTNGLNKCIYTNNTNVCDDGDECTVSDGCVEGICTGSAKNCDDGIDCTVNTCDSAVGCVATEDDSLCAADECKVAFCSEGVGCVQEADPVNGGACNGDECTENGTCQAGECVGDAVDCEDGDVCTGIDCNPTIGCTYLPATNKVCNDGDACTEADVCGVSGTGAAVCQGTQIPGCGEEGLICSLTGNAGDEVSCFLSIARSQENEVNALGIQFKMFYDPAKLTLINFYDDFCFMGICQDFYLTGPGKQTLSTGHALTAGPADASDWDGSGFAAFSNFSDTTAFFTDAYLDAGGVIQGGPEFVEARFTLVSNVTGASPAEVTLEEVEAFWDFGQDMVESFDGPVIITTPQQ